jgi:hypothetical protein
MVHYQPGRLLLIHPPQLLEHIQAEVASVEEEVEETLTSAAEVEATSMNASALQQGEAVHEIEDGTENERDQEIVNGSEKGIATLMLEDQNGRTARGRLKSTKETDSVVLQMLEQPADPRLPQRHLDSNQ